MKHKKYMITILSTIVLPGCVFMGCTSSSKNTTTQTTQTTRTIQTTQEALSEKQDDEISLSVSENLELPLLDTKILNTMHVYNCSIGKNYIDAQKVIKALGDSTLKLVSKERKDYPAIDQTYEWLEYEGDVQSCTVKIGPWGMSFHSSKVADEESTTDNSIAKRMIEDMTLDKREEIYESSHSSLKAMGAEQFYYSLSIEGIPYTEKCYKKEQRAVPGFTGSVLYTGDTMEEFSIGVKYQLGKNKKGAKLQCLTEEAVLESLEKYLRDADKVGAYSILQTKLVYASESEQEEMMIVPMLEVSLINEASEEPEEQDVMVSLYSSQVYQVMPSFQLMT